MSMLASPMLVGGKRKGREGKGENPFSLPPLHEGSWLEFPMLAGREWERGKGKEESCPRAFEIRGTSLWSLKSLNTGPFDLFPLDVSGTSGRVPCLWINRSPKDPSLPPLHEGF
jgi:hypothetical protein